VTRDADGLAVARLLQRPVAEAAVALLGSRLVAGPVEVRLTEVEAYDGEHDPASHAWRGRTTRNAVMFGPAGLAYVYRSYGVHWCLNVVTGSVGRASAVLLRAGEVVAGRAEASLRRPAARTPRDLARGPGRLTSVLGIHGGEDGHDGTDLLDPRSPVRLLARDGPPVAEPVRGPRVGVSRAADLAWRFWLPGEPSVSAYVRSPRAP